MKTKINFIKISLFSLTTFVPFMITTSCSNQQNVTENEARAFWNSIKSTYYPEFKSNFSIDFSNIDNSVIIDQINNSLLFIQPKDLTEENKNIFNHLKFEVIDIAFPNIGETTTKILVKVNFNKNNFVYKTYNLKDLPNFNDKNIIAIPNEEKLREKIKYFYDSGFENFRQTLLENINSFATDENNLAMELNNKEQAVDYQNIVTPKFEGVINEIIKVSFDKIYNNKGLENFQSFSINVISKTTKDSGEGNWTMEINFSFLVNNISKKIDDLVSFPLYFEKAIFPKENHE